MSREQRAQSIAPDAQESPRAVDTPRRLFDPNNPAPLVGVDVLAEVFGIGESAVYKNIKLGKYEEFAVDPPCGPKRWSGILLARYVKGEPLYVPTFGRKKRSA